MVKIWSGTVTQFHGIRLIYYIDYKVGLGDLYVYSIYTIILFTTTLISFGLSILPLLV